MQIFHFEFLRAGQAALFCRAGRGSTPPCSRRPATAPSPCKVAPERRPARYGRSRDHRRSLYQAPSERTPRARNRRPVIESAEHCVRPDQIDDVPVNNEIDAGRVGRQEHEPVHPFLIDLLQQLERLRILPPHDADVVERLRIAAGERHGLAHIVAVRLRQVGRADHVVCASSHRRDWWRPRRSSSRAPRRTPAASRRRSRPR